MNPVAEKYFSLNVEEQKKVQIRLCSLAYDSWLDYVKEKNIVNYSESVAGTVQKLDYSLPKDAIDAVLNGVDSLNISNRYQEPITAINDFDLEFSQDMELAYFSIYNLYKFHITREIDDSWLIINQALTSLGENNAVSNLKEAIEYVA